MSRSKPHTMWFVHDDGRGAEVVLHDYQRIGFIEQRRPRHESPGGIYIGGDPACDVVLAGLERFHVHYYGRGHHQYYEVIAGRASWGRDEPDDLFPGDSTRGEVRFGPWRPGRPEGVDSDAEVIAARSVADDARLEGRHAEAAAILARVGLQRFQIGPATALPPPLEAANRVLRVRVRDGDASVIHVVGSIERLATGITIGSDPACDVTVGGAGANQIKLANKRNELAVEVIAGAVERVGLYNRDDVQQRSFTVHTRWERFRLGTAIVQLCRWPGDGESQR